MKFQIFRIGQNQVNIATSDIVSYHFLSLFIHSCASVIYPETDLTSTLFLIPSEFGTVLFELGIQRWTLEILYLQALAKQERQTISHFSGHMKHSRSIQRLAASHPSITSMFACLPRFLFRPYRNIYSYTILVHRRFFTYNWKMSCAFVSALLMPCVFPYGKD